jgi:hypothetical protein
MPIWFIRDYSNPGVFEELLNACHQSKPGKLFVKWALVHLGKMTKGEYKVITEKDFKTVLKEGHFSKSEVALFKKECATVEAELRRPCGTEEGIYFRNCLLKKIIDYV